MPDLTTTQKGEWAQIPRVTLHNLVEKPYQNRVGCYSSKAGTKIILTPMVSDWDVQKAHMGEMVKHPHTLAMQCMCT